MAYRTASFLKHKLDEGKRNFTTYLHRWAASGQNDPDRFGRYVSKLPSGEFSDLGMRMMIMFSATQKGTPYDDGAFTDLCCKLIPGGRDAMKDRGLTVRKLRDDRAL